MVLCCNNKGFCQVDNGLDRSILCSATDEFVLQKDPSILKRGIHIPISIKPCDIGEQSPRSDGWLSCLQASISRIFVLFKLHANFFHEPII